MARSDSTRMSAVVSPAQATPSSMPLSEWGSGSARAKSRCRHPSKSPRITGATFSSKGWGTDSAYWPLSRIRWETRSGCSTAYRNASIPAHETATRAKGGRTASSRTARKSWYRVSRSYPRGRPVGAPVAPLVHRDHAEVTREVRDLVLELAAVRGRLALGQKEHVSAAAARRLIEELDPVPGDVHGLPASAEDRESPPVGARRPSSRSSRSVLGVTPEQPSCRRSAVGITRCLARGEASASCPAPASSGSNTASSTTRFAAARQDDAHRSAARRARS